MYKASNKSCVKYFFFFRLIVECCLFWLCFVFDSDYHVCVHKADGYNQITTPFKMNTDICRLIATRFFFSLYSLFEFECLCANVSMRY